MSSIHYEKAIKVKTVHKNYIELNGKRYDATTGALLGGVSHKPTPKPHRASKSKPLAQTAATQLIQPTKAHRRTSAKTVAPHKPQSTKTLMRHVVSKPSSDKKPTIKRHYPIKKSAADIVVYKKRSAHAVDTIRLKRAQQINKSQHIGHFQAKTSLAPIKARLQPVQVATAPAAKTKSYTVHKTTAPATPLSLTEKKTQLFEQALMNARSHEEPAHKPYKRSFMKRHRRSFSTVAAVLAIVLLGGFVVYLNKGSVELQVASARAGFQANMPTYKPSGYEQKSTASVGDKVAISFVSPTANNSFTLTQQPSDWNSQTLFDSVVADSGSYQAVQDNGRTIYIYGNDKAAWVDGSILYTISGSAHLSSDQITALAKSM